MSLFDNKELSSEADAISWKKKKKGVIVSLVFSWKHDYVRMSISKIGEFYFQELGHIISYTFKWDTLNPKFS